MNAPGDTYEVVPIEQGGTRQFDRQTCTLVVVKRGQTYRFALDHIPQYEEIVTLSESVS